MIVVAILAGGKSERMGQDKVFLEFHGWPMLALVTFKMQTAGLPVMVVGRSREELAAGGINFAPHILCVPDEKPGLGPVGGLVTALKNSRGADAVILVPCDTPNTSPIFIDWLYGQLRVLMESDNPPQKDTAWALVPWFIDHPEPLFAIYSKEVLPHAEQVLQGEKRSLRNLLTKIDTRLVDMHEDYVSSILDVDTPQDLEKARHIGPMF